MFPNFIFLFLSLCFVNSCLHLPQFSSAQRAIVPFSYALQKAKNPQDGKAVSGRKNAVPPDFRAKLPHVLPIRYADNGRLPSKPTCRSFQFALRGPFTENRRAALSSSATLCAVRYPTTLPRHRFKGRIPCPWV